MNTLRQINFDLDSVEIEVERVVTRVSTARGNTSRMSQSREASRGAPA